MNQSEIRNSILKFSSSFVEEKFNYVSNSDRVVWITDVDVERGAVHGGDREGTVTIGQIKDYAREFSKGEAVHIEQAIGSSSNNRSVVEALMAHHPNVAVCYQPKPGGSQDSKHTRWFDYVIHRPGRMLRRDDLGTKQTSASPELSEWTAPEWCLAVESARHLEKNPSDKDKLLALLDKSTSPSDWEQKINLVDFVRSGENDSTDYSEDQLEKARWYFRFTLAEYGRWDDYFGDTSPEIGLAEQTISTGPAGEKLCSILELEGPRSASGKLPGSKMVDMFVKELHAAGMHIDEMESLKASQLEDDYSGTTDGGA